MEYPATLMPARIPDVIIACDSVTAKHPLEEKEIILSNENNGSVGT